MDLNPNFSDNNFKVERFNLVDLATADNVSNSNKLIWQTIEPILAY